MLECVTSQPLIMVTAYHWIAVESDNNEFRLLRHLMSNYDRAVRPSRNASEALDITFGLALTQIIDVVSYLSRSRLIWRWPVLIFIADNRRNQSSVTPASQLQQLSLSLVAVFIAVMPYRLPCECFPLTFFKNFQLGRSSVRNVSVKSASVNWQFTLTIWRRGQTKAQWYPRWLR